MAETTGKLWFPNFCRFTTVFAVMLIAELVVLIIALAPGPGPDNLYSFISTVSFMVQWIAVISAGTLCALRPWFNRQPVWLGLLAAYVVILVICAIGSWGAGWMDRTLDLGFAHTVPDMADLVISNVLICALVAAAALRYFYVQQRWVRDVEARAQAQLRALQARIRPHFLFNSMNTIASLVRRHPERAERAVEDLSELFRAVLRTGSGSATLGDELELCRRYLDLEQLRLGDRLKVEWSVDALPLEAPIPSLTLQPILENAVYHGIQHLPTGGRIEIDGEADDSHWLLSVRNPVPEREPPTRDRGHGVAQDNIRARLDQRFAGRATMEITRADGHYRVELRVPLKEP